MIYAFSRPLLFSPAEMVPKSFFFFVVVVFLVAVSGDGGGSDSSPPNINLRSKSLILVKIYCLLLVFIGTFAGGISPYFFKWNEGFLVLGTQFAGAVFLGTALMHFLSDANETFGDLTEVEYPFAFMLAASGYALTMLADCAISHLVATGTHTKPDHHFDLPVKKADHQESLEPEKGTATSNGGGGFSHSEPKAEECPHNQSLKSLVSNASSLGDSILLIVALCFHSIFEGISIGVAENEADAWKALWTVSLHKVFAAVAMGIALLRMIPDRPFLSCTAYAFAFAISSPVGVAIGIVIDATTEGHVADWIFAISMGIACGVFIYVSINHLLAKGYKPVRPTVADSALNRWFAVVLGVTVIAVAMIWDT